MHVLTLVAPPATALDGASLRRLSGALHAEHAAWLAPEEAADLFFTTPPEAGAIADAIAGAAMDAIVQPAAGRAKRLLLADMDGTIVTTETLDELAAFAGLKDQVAAITTLSMNGMVPFREALIQRVALLRGLDLAALEHTWRATRLMPGAAALIATMRAHGATCALVSGGFTYFTSRVAAALGFDLHRANTLLDDGSTLTGCLAEPILDRPGKARVLHQLATARSIEVDQTMAVGDGANDLDMLDEAGLGVAFHAKPIVAQAARASVQFSDLGALLFIQGHARQDWIVPPAYTRSFT